MPKYEYSAQVLITSPTYTTINNVTSITIQKGRQQIQDPFKAGTCLVTGRLPNDLPAIAIGQKFLVQVDNVPIGSPISAPLQYFTGRISNFRINYGKVANEDVWEIEAEDVLGQMGRQIVSGSWSAGVSTLQAAQTFASAELTITGGGDSTVSAQTITNEPLLNVINKLAATEQAKVYPTGSATVQFRSRNAALNTDVEFTFTDGTLTAGSPNTNYDQVAFKSFADSYFTQVVVEPSGLAAQTSGTGDRVYSFSTYDQTTTQAKNLADYVLSTLSVNTGAPATISCNGETQANNSAIIQCARGDRVAWIGLILRGVLYYCELEGSLLTVTPEQTRMTFFVSAYQAANFFVLDHPFLGVLDTNKLGF